MSCARLSRRTLLAGGAALLPAYARAQTPTPLPGPALDPEGLAGFLPAFSSTAFDAPPATGGWGPVQLSPSGKLFLIERLLPDRRSVHLLDQDGELVRGYASPDCPYGTAHWGPTDATFYLECRLTPRGIPRWVRVDRATEKETAARMKGLPRWAFGGQDYLLALLPKPRGAGAGQYQRYRSDHTRVGEPLGVAEPAWSPDGRSLAFVTERPRPAGVSEEEFPPLREVRTLPARGTLARVVLSRAGWQRLMDEHGWKWASGPETVAWSPQNDALFGLCRARTGDEEVRFLLRMDLRAPQRQIREVGETTHLVSASGDGKHWILEMDRGIFRLDFKGK